MIDRHLCGRGIRDPRVIRAFATVEREAFVAPDLAGEAYDDRPLPIESGQTISQPYIVAAMAEAAELRADETVLEIGTGSGYAAAVLAQLAARVYTIECLPNLAEAAAQRLARFPTVEVRCGDGTLGWPEHAPYDAIIVAAAGPSVPRALLAQLAVHGRLVMPVGDDREQELVRVTRASEAVFHREDLGGVQFVPLIGAQGWRSEREDAHETRQPL